MDCILGSCDPRALMADATEIADVLTGLPLSSTFCPPGPGTRSAVCFHALARREKMRAAKQRRSVVFLCNIKDQLSSFFLVYIINRSDYPAVTVTVILLCPCRIWAAYKHIFLCNIKDQLSSFFLVYIINRSDYPAVTVPVILLCPCRIWAAYKHSYYYYYYYKVRQKWFNF
eukprot:sb/3472110/